jgi:hypothetical protein
MRLFDRGSFLAEGELLKGGLLKRGLLKGNKLLKGNC